MLNARDSEGAFIKNKGIGQQPEDRPIEKTHLEKDLLRIAGQCAALPDLDTRSADEILEYGADGLP
jgi:hypothetical protein